VARRDWVATTGRLIDAIGRDDFASVLSTGLREIAPFEYTVIFGFLGSQPPLDLYDDFPPDTRRVFVEDYQEGPYLLDPFFLACMDGTPPGLWRLREIAPDRFRQGEYFRNYYVQTGLAEEACYLVQLENKASLAISLMRRRKAFTQAEVTALKSVWPVVDAVARRHWQDLAGRFGAPSVPDSQPIVEDIIAQAFSAVGEGVLTARERQVVQYTLKGHSAEAIGQILAIAPGTVRIHRRNIYAKLRINSQGELFSRFIGALAGARQHGGR
jgi:DNA-binding CsgD family transcriptional regulator